MRILIICTGNTCRSPMAEGIFKSLIKKNRLDIEVSSAGTFAFDGDKVSHNSVLALKKLDIDISNHKSTLVHQDLLDKSDIVLTMTISHKETLKRKFTNIEGKIYLLNEYAFGELRDIIDPMGGGLMQYEKARDEIYLAVEEIVRLMTTKSEQ